MADEQLAGEVGVDPPVVDGAVHRQRHPEQRDPLGGHGRPAPLRPARLGVGAGDQVARGALDPRGIHPGDGARPQPGGLHQFGGHHHRRRPFRERGPGPDREPRTPGALVLGDRAPLGFRLPLLRHRERRGQPDLREQAREHRLVHAVRDVLGQLPVRTPGAGLVAREAELVAELAQLRVEVLPLAHAQVVEVLGDAALAELVARQLAAPAAHVLPEVQPGQEIRAGIGEAGVRGVRLGGLVRRPLAGILGREPGRDDHDLVQAAQLVGLEHHATDARVDRQPGQRAPDVRQPGGIAADHGPQLGEQADAVAHRGAIGGVDERELLDRAELGARHLQDDRGEVGALDLGVGELGSGVEVVGGVEPDADAVRDAPAAPGALGGRGLRDRLDGQALDLRAPRVARDARGPRVDDVADAGHGQRRLGDVGGQHDATPSVPARLEHPVLLGGGQPRVQRQDVEVHLGGLQRLGGVADLPLAGEEHQDVTGRALAAELGDGVDDALDLVAGLGARVVGVGQGAVPDLDGERAAGHLDDRRIAEVAGEPVRVDRRRGDDHLEVRTPGQQLGEVAEQEVDVEAALVGLVDDEGVVAAQQAVLLDLGEQDAVGHELDERVVARPAGEAHLVADGVRAGRAELLGDALGDRAGGDAPRLGVPDGAQDPAPGLERDLGQLRGLARPGLARDDDHLVVGEGGLDVVDPAGERQLRRVRHRRHRGPAALEPGVGLVDGDGHLLERVRPTVGVGHPAGAVEPATQPVGVGGSERGDPLRELDGERGRAGHRSGTPRSRERGDTAWDSSILSVGGARCVPGTSSYASKPLIACSSEYCGGSSQRIVAFAPERARRGH